MSSLVNNNNPLQAPPPSLNVQQQMVTAQPILQAETNATTSNTNDNLHQNNMTISTPVLTPNPIDTQPAISSTAIPEAVVGGVNVPAQTIAAPVGVRPALMAVAQVAPAADGKEEYEEIREQDRYLPIANIARIMKNTLPENAKIAKDSKETVQECVSEFISFITSEASDKCMQEKRKTINGDDLLWAMSTLGFDKYVEPLRLYLTKYREAIRGDKPDHGGGGKVSSSGGANAGNPTVDAGPVMTVNNTGGLMDLNGTGVPPPS